MLSCWRSLLIFVGALGLAHSAHAHGIAGNRYFPGTLTFDDPAVADELLFDYATLQHPAEVRVAVDHCCLSFVVASAAAAEERAASTHGLSLGSRLAPTWANLAKRQ